MSGADDQRGADDWQWTAFDDVDRTAAAMDLLEYCDVLRAAAARGGAR